MLVLANSRFSYKNTRGLRIDLAPLSDIWLQSITDSISNNINSFPLYNFHGEVFNDMRMAPRYLTLAGFVKDLKDLNLVQQVFNPTLKGTLTNNNSQKSISVLVEDLPTVKWEQGQGRFLINLTALSPFWESLPTVGFMQKIEGKMHFPLILPPEGFIFGIESNIYDGVFVNNGDVEIGWIATLRARGRVENPYIENMDTGEIIQLNTTLHVNDVAVLTMMPGNFTFTINDRNFLSAIDSKSSFFKFGTGNTKIKYGASLNVSLLDVEIKYTPLFVGGD